MSKKKWCMCKTVTSVARDMDSTCMQCGGKDAYKKSKDRPIVEPMKKDKIREAFEFDCDPWHDEYWVYEAGYKSAMQSAQEEKEMLVHEISENKWMMANQKLKITKLQAVADHRKCCGNCELESSSSWRCAECYRLNSYMKYGKDKPVDNWEAKK